MPCVVFGNGELPGKDILVVSYLSSEGGGGEDSPSDPNDTKRRLEEEDGGNSFDWECTEFTENGLKFNMNFTNPLAVSENNKSPDKLSITLKQNTFFAKGSFEPMTGTLKLNIPIPK